MDSMPNRLPDLQFQQVGNYVRVFNPHNGGRYKLPIKQALLLLSLDGKSWPGESTGLNLSREELFQGLRKLYRNGLLQNAVQKPTFLHDEPGMALLLFPCSLGDSIRSLLFYQYSGYSGFGFRFFFLLLLLSPSTVVCLACPH